MADFRLAVVTDLSRQGTRRLVAKRHVVGQAQRLTAEKAAERMLNGPAPGFRTQHLAPASLANSIHLQSVNGYSHGPPQELRNWPEPLRMKVSTWRTASVGARQKTELIE